MTNKWLGAGIIIVPLVIVPLLVFFLQTTTYAYEEKPYKTLSPFYATNQPPPVFPLQGEVLMPFSPHALAYCPIVRRYALTESVRVYADAHTPVPAATSGRVLETGHSYFFGYFITIDHGNGIIAVYGELFPDKYVKPGDPVAALQPIGRVSTRPIHSQDVGEHFYFRVMAGGEAIDPFAWSGH